MPAPVGVGNITGAHHAFKGRPQLGSASAETVKGKIADGPAHQARASIEAANPGEAAPANLHGKVTSAVARGIDISSLLVLQSAEPSGSDLIFLDFEVSAKGGIPGGNGGGGGGKDKGGGGDPTVLSTYTSGDAGGYNIEINFKGSWTSDLQAAFITSSEQLSALITGDIADVFYRGKIIDDIRIDVKLSDIDGEGGILGRAGPTAIRTDGYLPATAIMEFDIADATTFNTMPSGSEGTLWDDIVFHEMMHSIGFGTIWTYQDLLSGGGTGNPTFTGLLATDVYEATSGVTNSGGVPVEQDGGAGTRDSHWDEETFDNEIMTGYINNSDNNLSDMTVASLEDLGYDTVFTA